MKQKDNDLMHNENRPSDDSGTNRGSVVGSIDQQAQDFVTSFDVKQTRNSVTNFGLQQTRDSNTIFGVRQRHNSTISSDVQKTHGLDKSFGVQQARDSGTSFGVQQTQNLDTCFGVQLTQDLATSFGVQQTQNLDTSFGVQQTKDLATSSGVQHTQNSVRNPDVQLTEDTTTSSDVQQKQDLATSSGVQHTQNSVRNPDVQLTEDTTTSSDVQQKQDLDTSFGVKQSQNSARNPGVQQTKDLTTSSDVQQTQDLDAGFGVKQTQHSARSPDVQQTEDSNTSFGIQQTQDSATSSDYDTDLDENEETFYAKEREAHESSLRENAGSGHVTYTEICASLGITPIRRILDQFRLTEMRLEHVGMSGNDCKALACALWHNTTIEALDLEENGLCGEDLVPVINVLKNNIHITSLSLRDNIVDTVAAMAIDDVLGEPECQLVQLNLSGTHIGDKEVEYISAGIQNNTSLVWLSLSHNNISINGAKKLGRAIGDTATLQYLDLSWNHIRMGGAVAVLKGLKINSSIISMNLGMNGLGYEGSLALEETLRENTCLKTFDVSNNRINWEGVSFVAKGLKKNGSLRMLQIGNNPINMEGCYELVKAAASPKCNVLHIGLDNIPVNGAVLVVAEQLLKSRRFSLTHGGILDTRDIVGIRKEKREDPLTLIVRYLAMTGIRMIDLFRMFDYDNAGMVSKEHFIRGLKRVGVPLPHNELVNVARRLDRGKKGSISYSILANGVRNHIREERKEDRRQEVKKRLKIEERRRILQTELPSIFKRSYNDDLSLYYATLSSVASSPYSSSANLHSVNHAVVLPPIAQSDKIVAKDKKEMTSSEDMKTADQNDVKMGSPKKLAFKEEVKKKPYKLLKYLNAYLDRRKTEASFDQSLLQKTE